MNRKAIPEITSDLIWRLTEDGAVLVSPESGNIRVLNDVGTAIWQMIDGKRNVAQIESRLQEKYDVPAERLRSDLVSFLDELSERRLLTWTETERPEQ